MIIVEGADLVGKTTFCHKLLEFAALRDTYWYRHLSKPPVGASFCSCYVELAMRCAVQDRFHMSEVVYSRVRDEKEASCSPEKYRLVDAHLRTLGAITVIIVTDIDVLKRRYEETARDEMYDLEKILYANELFTEICQEGGSFEGYRMDLDLFFTLDDEIPFPTDAMARTVVDAYCKRQAQLDLIVMESADEGPRY